jgi:hypothetical protein
VRKRKKSIQRLIVRVIAMVLFLSILFGLGFGLFRFGVWIFTGRTPAQEDETLFLSPPNEEILFVKPQGGIFITDPHGRSIRQLTNANDLSPSWKRDGDGFYFLRQNPSRELHLMYYDYIRGQLSESAIQTFTMIEIPNPEGDTIKISPDGSHIAVSSYDWGIQIIEVASKKIVSRSFHDCWEYWGMISRNSKFSLITVRPHQRALSFIEGVEKTATKPSLWLIQTDLKSKQLIDSSEEAFQGYSFSLNGYTFAYAKENQMYYVDSIQKIEPIRVTDGITPAIRPSGDAKKYRLIKPFWADFDASNLVDMLQWGTQRNDYMVWGTPNNLALLDLDKQSLHYYVEGRKKDRYLGWKMMDFFLADINDNHQKQLLTSWWQGGNHQGAERISIFTIKSSEEKLNEVFRSQNKYHNRIQISDLNGDGIKDLLNMYSDVSGEGNPALDALIWSDVYTWDGAQYRLNNEQFVHMYRELIETYQSFLARALRDPDAYGSGLYLIRELMQKAQAIIEQG